MALPALLMFLPMILPAIKNLLGSMFDGEKASNESLVASNGAGFSSASAFEGTQVAKADSADDSGAIAAGAAISSINAQQLSGTTFGV